MAPEKALIGLPPATDPHILKHAQPIAQFARLDPQLLTGSAC
jgi:hypothetical protein